MAWPVASMGSLVGEGACGSCFSVGQAERVGSVGNQSRVVLKAVLKVIGTEEM